MKYILKTLLWAGILALSWFLGITLLADFVLWKMALFFLLAKVLGEILFRAFRWIDVHYG